MSLCKRICPSQSTENEQAQNSKVIVSKDTKQTKKCCIRLTHRKMLLGTILNPTKMHKHLTQTTKMNTNSWKNAVRHPFKPNKWCTDTQLNLPGCYISAKPSASEFRNPDSCVTEGMCGPPPAATVPRTIHRYIYLDICCP